MTPLMAHSDPAIFEEIAYVKTGYQKVEGVLIRLTMAHPR
jgi:hypothetical protein